MELELESVKSPKIILAAAAIGVVIAVAFMLFFAGRPLDGKGLVLNADAKQDSAAGAGYVVGYYRDTGRILGNSTHIIPRQTIIKYVKGGMQRWDLDFGGGFIERLYHVPEGTFLCDPGYNSSGFTCSGTDGSAMQEFLKPDLGGADAALGRALSEGALRFGAIGNDTFMGRGCDGVGFFIFPGQMTQQDYDGHVFGSVAGLNASSPFRSIGEMDGYTCFDSETGIPLRTAIVYNSSVQDFEGTVYVQLSAFKLERNGTLSDGIFALPQGAQ